MLRCMSAYVVALLAATALPAWADNVLVVHGLSTTSETGTTQQNIDNWPVVCNAQNQHTVTYADAMPSDLSSYQQIWDIRFDNSGALTSAEMTAYANALSAGVSFFLMGENSGFLTRDESIFQFVNQVGGGQLTFNTSNGYSTNPQTLYAPLDSNGLQTVSFNAGGTATATGLTGTMTSVDTAFGSGDSGSSFFWKRGQLSNAPAGQLAVVLDVNFMMTDNASQGNNGQFFSNLCEQLSLPPPTINAIADGGASTTVVAGNTLAFDVLSNDAATGDTLDFSSVVIATQPSHGRVSSIDPATGAITYTAASGYAGADSFEYRVCLKNTPTTCGVAKVTLTVVAPAQTPAIMAADDGGPNLVVNAGQLTSIPVLANDIAQGDTVDPSTVKITVNPTKGLIEAIDPSTGAISYRANAGVSGAESFKYQVCLKNNPAICSSAQVQLQITATTIPGVALAHPVPATDNKILIAMGLLLMAMALGVQRTVRR